MYFFGSTPHSKDYSVLGLRVRVRVFGGLHWGCPYLWKLPYNLLKPSESKRFLACTPQLVPLGGDYIGLYTGYIKAILGKPFRATYPLT